MNVADQRLPTLIAILAASMCLGFAAFTGHMWEDYFITFRSSLNLATGNGFVYQPGERVHTFTSPLGTLLPALFALGGGEDVAVRALWCFRLVSAGALAAALWLAARTMQRGGLVPLAIAAAGTAWALDPKTIDFSINGMETALLVFFVVLTWRAFSSGARVLPCACAFAGLQWTRPDGGVFFAVVALAWWMLGDAAALEWRQRLRVAICAAALGTLLYLPWLMFTWLYYGTPVPHTMYAKISHYGPGELAPALLLYPWRLVFGHVALHEVFMPAYFYFGGWPAALAWVARVLALGAALAWALPGIHAAGRLASAAFLLGGLYVECIPRSPWYYPGWQALAFVAWAYLFHWGLAASRGKYAISAATRVAAGTFVLLQAALLVCVAWQMRTQQDIIEERQRTVIGRWLRDSAVDGDRVYLEPLGYVGYFSGLKMLDYPGLAAREVVAARRAGLRPHAQLIRALQPEWLVLRPDQVSTVQTDDPQLLGEQYRRKRVFDMRAAVDAVKLIPGRGYLEFDAVFHVFERVRPETPRQ